MKILIAQVNLTSPISVHVSEIDASTDELDF